MAYQLVRIDELMAHEFAFLEADLNHLSESDLQHARPSGISFDALIEQLKTGAFGLLSDAPNAPMLYRCNASWVMTEAGLTQLHPEGQTRIMQRTGAGVTPRSANAASPQASQHSPLLEIDKVYTREPVRPDAEPDPDDTYEYSFEVFGDANVLEGTLSLHPRLAKTKAEAIATTRWQKTPTPLGTKLTGLATVNETKQLQFEQMGYTREPRLPHRVTLAEQGTSEAKDAFIPIIPTVQLDGRLGRPTHGYYYHFHHHLLVQELKIVGRHNFAFNVTWSTHARLDQDHHSANQSALLVFWRLDGQLADNQHLVYLDRPITPEERDHVDETWLCEHGLKLDIAALCQAPSQPFAPATPPQSLPTGTFGLPPTPPQDYNRWENCYYAGKGLLLPYSTLRRIHPDHAKAVALPVVRVTTLPDTHVLRIGVFFDGTGNNHDNDRYKETYSNKSRTNVARLFDAYPIMDGKQAKIYVSGVGTKDLDALSEAERAAIIDAGQDEERFPTQATGLDSVFGTTGAHVKWQNLLKELKRQTLLLEQQGIYEQITHIEFDVFGFSRGAALARHFVNAAVAGMPDYSKPRQHLLNFAYAQDPHTPGFPTIQPNLLGDETLAKWPAIDPRSTVDYQHTFYPIDTQRPVSMRFVGLYDTVGSFYLAGNADEGEFQLGLSEDCATQVFHIVAAHEYRHHFPLTSLDPKGELKAMQFRNFSQEIFPGCHADIGGGYPSQTQYNRLAVPAHVRVNDERKQLTETQRQRYQAATAAIRGNKPNTAMSAAEALWGFGPVQDTFIRELDEARSAQYTHALASLQQQFFQTHGATRATARQFLRFRRQKVVQYQQAWRAELTVAQIYGEVLKVRQGQILCYRFIPISQALATLSLLRMKQQAEQCGIAWVEKLFTMQHDFQSEPLIQTLWRRFELLPLGTIDHTSWQDTITQLSQHFIHRPHDKLINLGYFSVTDYVVNRVSRARTHHLKRTVFPNVQS